MYRHQIQGRYLLTAVFMANFTIAPFFIHGPFVYAVMVLNLAASAWCLWGGEVAGWFRVSVGCLLLASGGTMLARGGRGLHLIAIIASLFAGVVLLLPRKRGQTG